MIGKVVYVSRGQSPIFQMTQICRSAKDYGNEMRSWAIYNDAIIVDRYGVLPHQGSLFVP